MTASHYASLMEAIMDLRSEFREDVRAVVDRLDKIDERLRAVEMVQAVAREIEVKTDLSGKWKAGIATSIAAALAALLQALAEKGN